MVGPGPLQVQQTVDIVMGAIDAWLSIDVRRSAANSSVATTHRGAVMLNVLKAGCGDSKPRMTTADAWLSAAVFLGGTCLMLAIGTAAGRLGYPELGGALKSLSFSVALALSMPFSFMKGQPRRAQAAVLAVVLLILTAAAFLSTMI
jgi:hypothetical protein